MWQVDRSSIDVSTESWRVFTHSGDVLAFTEVVEHWRGNAEFRSFWNASLREVPFDAYCWECPPITVQSSTRPFECVFVSSPMLARMPPDPGPFSEYFRPDREVVSFESLGKDAWLVAPCPGGQGSNFSHLASFVATATEAQQSALWSAVGTALEKRISARPTWLSTAGGGVAWLHVRLDTRPKYYRHAPYRRAGNDAISSSDRGA